MKKTALRTDDSRFHALPDYPFKPHYLFVSHPDYHALRLHFIDERSTDVKTPAERCAETVLLLHGCPSWSYLYRKVIRHLRNNDNKNPCRILAPDFIGCGKSDKLLARTDYSYDLYVQWLTEFILQLDLDNISLVCQDWGGPIGLRVASEMPQRFRRIIAANTLLPNAEAPPRGVADWPGDIIRNWVRFTQAARDIPVSQVMQGVCLEKLPAAVLAAYDAPFPDASYKQGILQWPSLIPLDAQYPGIVENRRTWDFLEHSDIPFITAFSDSDPSTAAWETVFQNRVKGAQQRTHSRIVQAAHMLQEDKPDALAQVIENALATF